MRKSGARAGGDDGVEGGTGGSGAAGEVVELGGEVELGNARADFGEELLEYLRGEDGGVAHGGKLGGILDGAEVGNEALGAGVGNSTRCARAGSANRLMSPMVKAIIRHGFPTARFLNLKKCSN